jgi:drug/metabolite transporter (DMT)-like permease
VVVAVAMATTAGLRRPVRADRSILLSVGLGQLAFVTAAVFVALRFVPPGRSSILVYASALWTAPLAVAFLQERLTRARVAGLSTGCAGVVLLLEPWALDWTDGRLLLGIGLLLAAAVANAATMVHVRGHRWVGTPLQLMPFQFGIAAIPMAVVAAAVDGVPSVRWDATTVAIVAYQILFGSSLGVWGHLTLGRSLPAITVNLTLMAVPVVGLASSVVLIDESLTPAVAVSLVLVLTGVAFGVASDLRSTDRLQPA